MELPLAAAAIRPLLFHPLRPVSVEPSPDLPWPEFATPAILALLTGEERKPVRAACRAGRDAVDAGITRLELEEMRNWGGGQRATPWASVRIEPVRLPALRHLDLCRCSSDWIWAHHGAAHMRGAARLVAAHAASLLTLSLSFYITPRPESHRKRAALERGFLESVLLAAPLPALRRLDVQVGCPTRNRKARCLESLSPLARLSLPSLTRLSLWAEAATGQGVRWLEGAHLPALRHLEVRDSYFRPEQSCAAALAAPRWSALESLELGGYSSDSGGMAVLSAALAPTLRRLVVSLWPFGTEGCAEEWPQLRSLEANALPEHLGPVRLPRLERLAVRGGDSLRGLAARRAALPALRVVELQRCCYCCGSGYCPVVGCTRKETVELLEELQAAWPGLELRRQRPNDWTQA